VTKHLQNIESIITTVLHVQGNFTTKDNIKFIQGRKKSRQANSQTLIWNFERGIEVLFIRVLEMSKMNTYSCQTHLKCGSFVKKNMINQILLLVGAQYHNIEKQYFKFKT